MSRLRSGKTALRLLLLLLLIAAVVAYFVFDLGRYLSLDALRAQRQSLAHWIDAHAWLAAGGFFGVYVMVTALSVPGAAILTLAAGALFGLIEGTVLVSFASAIGATLAFLSSRFILRDAIKQRFGRRLKAIDRGVERDGAFYLFTLRLVPIFPFFVINLLMGLTGIRTWLFYAVSQIGMLPGTLVYVNAGTQLGELHSLSGIASPGLIGSFVLLGLFPLIARWVLRWIKARRVYRGWDKPKRFDRNLIVIGAGSAGLVSAYIAATVRAKVTLIEKHKMGGDCLNYGCVPSKALIRSARFAADARRADKLGFEAVEPKFDFAAIMQRIQRVIETIEPHDSVERYRKLGVDVRRGTAKITNPWTVEIDGEPLTTRAIVIAAGADPFVPPIDGLEEAGYLTSDTVWDLREWPARLAVLGGGPIGCELAQAFARLGSQVTQVEMMPRLLGREDDEVSELVRKALEADGVRVLIEHKALRVEQQGEDKTLVAEHGDQEISVPFDAILVAVGRKPRTEGYGLEELEIPVAKSRTVDTDDYLQTLYPNIYACGDVAGPYQFTHTAAHQAWYATVNALFGTFKRFRVDDSVIPAVTFTEPEVARVGLNEREAKDQEREFEVTCYALEELDRAITEEAPGGFVKVLTEPGKDAILGATVIAEHAGEMLAEFVLAMKTGTGLNKILGTIHAYPTFAEANKYAAGNWKKAHQPERLLKFAERFHRWRRG